MSHHLPSFVSLSPNSSMSIAIANGASVLLHGIGTIPTPSLSLSNVYCILGLIMNTAFVGKICDSGYNMYLSHHLPSFVSLSPNSSMSIAIANGVSVPLQGIGTIATPSLSLSNVYYILGLL